MKIDSQTQRYVSPVEFYNPKVSPDFIPAERSPSPETPKPKEKVKKRRQLHIKLPSLNVPKLEKHRRKLDKKSEENKRDIYVDTRKHPVRKRDFSKILVKLFRPSNLFTVQTNQSRP